MQSVQNQKLMATTIEVFIQCAKHDLESIRRNFNDVCCSISYDGRTIKVTLGTSSYTIREIAITGTHQEYDLCRSAFETKVE